MSLADTLRSSVIYCVMKAVRASITLHLIEPSAMIPALLLKRDTPYAFIAGIPTVPDASWTIVGDEDLLNWKDNQDELGSYFSDGCVDGCVLLMDANQDAALFAGLEARLEQWWNMPDDSGNLPSACLERDGNIVVARYAVEPGRLLWVVAESGGAGAFDDIRKIALDLAGGAIEDFVADHMELDSEHQVLELGQCPLIWNALMRIGTAPQPPVGISSPHP